MKDKIKPYLVLVPLFCFATLQGSFFKINLVLLFVLIWAVIRRTSESLLVAFLAGLFLDLAMGLPLGSSSLFFLSIAFLLNLYSRKYDPAHPFFLGLFVFTGVFAYDLIFSKPWFWEAILLTVLAVVLRPVVKYFSRELEGRAVRLKI